MSVWQNTWASKILLSLLNKPLTQKQIIKETKLPQSHVSTILNQLYSELLIKPTKDSVNQMKTKKKPSIVWEINYSTLMKRAIVPAKNKSETLKGMRVAGIFNKGTKWEKESEYVYFEKRLKEYLTIFKKNENNIELNKVLSLISEKGYEKKTIEKILSGFLDYYLANNLLTKLDKLTKDMESPEKEEVCEFIFAMRYHYGLM